jgi:hypothetical protein
VTREPSSPEDGAAAAAIVKTPQRQNSMGNSFVCAFEHTAAAHSLAIREFQLTAEGVRARPPLPISAKFSRAPRHTSTARNRCFQGTEMIAKTNDMSSGCSYGADLGAEQQSTQYNPSRSTG